AALASASLAVCGVFIYTSVQPLSDTLATFWCTAAVWAALRSRSRGRVWAAGSGWAFSVALLVRPTDALLLPALIIFLGQRKNWLAAAVAGIPLAAILALDNYLLYGSPLRSGYGKLSDLFSVAYFWPSVSHFSVWLVRVLPLGLFALPAVVILAGKKPRWLVAGLVVWAAAFGFCYSFYSFSPQDWSFFRFVEPAFPALLALACLGLQTLVDRLPEPARARRAGLIAAGALGLATLTNLSFHVPDARKHDRKYVEAAAWVQKNAPPSAILLSQLFSGTLYFRTAHTILRWEMPSARDEAGYLATLNKTGRPVYAVLDATEVTDFLLKNTASGKWEQMTGLGEASIWRLTPDGSR
ncbi:MAG TPA: hypothetical protein VGP93_16275, partial [Polyangiaceae bacterium]|nr:hypothetical protein [Polyangiaceae bacterium]